MLLNSDSQASAVSALSVTSEDWTATYDIVELEFISILPSAAAAHMLIEPIDSGSASSTNLRSEQITIQSATLADENSATLWTTSVTHEITNSAHE